MPCEVIFYDIFLILSYGSRILIIETSTRYECLITSKIKFLKIIIGVHPLCAQKDYVICSIVDTFVVLLWPSAEYFRPSCSSCTRSVPMFGCGRAAGSRLPEPEPGAARRRSRPGRRGALCRPVASPHASISCPAPDRPNRRRSNDLSLFN